MIHKDIYLIRSADDVIIGFACNGIGIGITKSTGVSLYYRTLSHFDSCQRISQFKIKTKDKRIYEFSNQKLLNKFIWMLVRNRDINLEY